MVRQVPFQVKRVDLFHKIGKLIIGTEKHGFAFKGECARKAIRAILHVRVAEAVRMLGELPLSKLLRIFSVP